MTTCYLDDQNASQIVHAAQGTGLESFLQATIGDGWPVPVTDGSLGLAAGSMFGLVLASTRGLMRRLYEVTRTWGHR